MAHCLNEPRGAPDRWLPYDAVEANMDTTAILDGDEWVLNGRKQFISNGCDATLYVVYANTDDTAPMSRGTSSFLVARETPGLEVTRCNETIGGPFMNNGEIAFHDCRVPADHLLVHHDALAQASIYFRPGKVLVAAKSLGIGVGACEETVRFVHSRLQGRAHRASGAGLTCGRHGHEARGRGGPAAPRGPGGRRALGGRRRVVQHGQGLRLHEAVTVCQNAMELHGGYGAMLDVGVETYMRDALISLHSDGTTDVSNFKIVKAMFPATAGRYAVEGSS